VSAFTDYEIPATVEYIPVFNAVEIALVTLACVASIILIIGVICCIRRKGKAAKKQEKDK
jgi:hypothetical protein